MGFKVDDFDGSNDGFSYSRRRTSIDEDGTDYWENREKIRDQMTSPLGQLSSQDLVRRLPMRLRKYNAAGELSPGRWVPDWEAIGLAAGLDSRMTDALTASLRELSRRDRIKAQQGVASQKKQAAAYERVRTVLEPMLSITVSPRNASELVGRRETARQRAERVLPSSPALAPVLSAMIEKSAGAVPTFITPTEVFLSRRYVGENWTGTSRVESSPLSAAPATAAKERRGSVEENGKTTPFIGSLRR